MSKKNFKLGERVFVDNSGVAGMAGNEWGGSEGVVTHEPNLRGHVRVRLDKVPAQHKPVHDCLDGLWCYVNHVSRVKRVERKFEIGDRVFVAHEGIKYAPDAWNGSYGTVTGNFIPTINSVLVRLDDVPYILRDMHEGMGGLWCDVENVSIVEREKPKNEVPSPCELRLSFVGNATTMSLVGTDGNVTCSATARCHPDDKFSVAEGMTIAFDRLYQKYQKQNPNRSTIMLGDKVRVMNDAPLPLITNYGNTDKPSEIVLNEAGTVTSLSPNSENAIVEWRENVVAVAATAGLEIVREPKYRKGDILVTRKNGCYVRVTKDYYEWEEKVPFETVYKVCGELTPDCFIGKLDD